MGCLATLWGKKRGEGGFRGGFQSNTLLENGVPDIKLGKQRVVDSRARCQGMVCVKLAEAKSHQSHSSTA